ncbi:MAG: hypothetical protein L6R36_008047 [Xanthoria steineri]|nr:MAG: hypothetical protein L6R36_008047 [Xanthoria steineri]
MLPGSKSKSSQHDNKPNLDNSKSTLSKVPFGIQQRYSNYQYIELEDATTVRRKLKELLTDKCNMPGTNESWTQAGISKEMKNLELRDGAVEYYKKFYRADLWQFSEFPEQSPGGEDLSHAHVLISKGIIPSSEFENGSISSEAGKERKRRSPDLSTEIIADRTVPSTMPKGHRRGDPATVRMWVGPGNPGPSQGKLADTEGLIRFRR